MPGDDLDLALNIKADFKNAHRDLVRLNKQVGTTGTQARKSSRRMRGFATGINRASAAAKRARSAFGGLRGALVGLGVAQALRLIVTNTARQEKAIAQVEQRIRSTGGAAGLTSRQLQDMATSLQDVTTFGDEAVLEMQALLLSFTNIAGEDVFARATESVLDLAIGVGTDLRSAAIQLGKALNDPIAGLNGLSRAGTTFTQTQKDLIKELVESGRVMDAQIIILDEIQKQYGGAARAARNTLGGALESLKNAFGDLLEAGEGSSDQLRQSIETFTEMLKDPQVVAAAREFASALLGIFEFVVKNFDKLIAVGAVYFGYRLGSAVGGKYGGAAGAIAGLAAAIALIQSINVDSPLEKAAEDLADNEAALTKITKDLELAQATLARMNEGLAKRIEEHGPLAFFDPHALDPLKAEIKELEELRQKLEEERARLVEILDRGVNEVDLPLDSSASTPTEIPSPTTEQEPEANKALEAYIEMLERAAVKQEELSALYMAQRDIASGALGKLSREEQNRVMSLAAQVDLQRKLNEEEEQSQRIKSEHKAEIQNIAIETESLLDPYQRAVAEATRWREMTLENLDDSAKDHQKYADEVERIFREQIARAAEEAAERQLRAATDWKSGATRALRDIAADARDVGDEVEDAMSEAFSRLEDVIVDFVTTGKASFGDFVNFVIREIVRLQVQRFFIAPFSDFLGGLFPAPVGHAGAVVGAAGGVRRMVDPRVFAFAPRYHAGGVAGLGPNEIPVIARRGETILSSDQAKALGARLNETHSVSIEFVNQGTPQEEVSRTARVDGGRMMVSVVVDDVGRNGPVAQSLQRTYGLQRSVA